MKRAIAVAAVLPLAAVVFLAAGFQFEADARSQAEQLNIDALPGLARELLPWLEQQRQQDCPELPLVWLIAETQAESSWDPRAFSSAGAAGLVQFMPGSWVEAGGDGGSWSTRQRPGSGHPVWDPRQHFATALPWMCRNLRMVMSHLATTGKSAEVLDAFAVCHIAGCSRVTRSRTGIPSAGEAGCGSSCSRQVHSYIETIHRWVAAYLTPISTEDAGGTGSATPYRGGATGCVLRDPSGTGGCVTRATAWMLTQVTEHFPSRPVACWDRHAWNPASDHPRGKACDFTFGRLGRFPGPADEQAGWQVAKWMRANAGSLRIKYVIWQGRIWSAARSGDGWRPYGGGGVYDPDDPTGGHYDHIHVSMAA